MLNEPPWGSPTWVDPLGSNEWATINWPGQEAMHSGLVMLVASKPDHSLCCVGTGFVISARGSYAVCASAAHNFYAGFHRVQNPHPRHHPTTPPEFRSNFEHVDLTRAHAIYRHGDTILICKVTAAAWDKHSDVCVFEIEAQSPHTDDFLQGEWQIAVKKPVIGSVVGLLGYADMDMATTNESKGSGLAEGQISSRLLLRVGRVIDVTSVGILTNCPQIKTSIPVFPGMSGGPVFAWGAYEQTPQVCGFISSGDEEEIHNNVENQNFDIPGRSNVILLPTIIKERHALEYIYEIKLDCMNAVLGQFRSPLKRMS